MRAQRGLGSRVGRALRGAKQAATLAATLAAVLAASGCKTGAERLSGRYRSTWGVCVVEVKGNEAAIAYPRGFMKCQVEGEDTLRCRWQSDEAQGKAVFRGQADLTLRGTWGRGESESDGGAWVMAR